MHELFLNWEPRFPHRSDGNNPKHCEDAERKRVRSQAWVSLSLLPELRGS